MELMTVLHACRMTAKRRARHLNIIGSDFPGRTDRTLQDRIERPKQPCERDTKGCYNPPQLNSFLFDRSPLKDNCSRRVVMNCFVVRQPGNHAHANQRTAKPAHEP